MPKPSSDCIIANGISRSFKSVKRQPGLKGSLQILFKPEYLVHEALKKVSFSIAPGEFIGLIGANGAGKTTLLKILSGLIPPSSGDASVLGFAPFERKMEFRKSLSLVMGQKAQLWWDLPASDAFDLIKAIYDIPESLFQDRLKSLCKLLDVERLLQTQIRRLSLGERMKMELIGALLHWPKVIFLDEPTIGLDVVAAQRLRDFLKHFNQTEKATIILTSHNMDDIEQLCSRVLILKDGELIYDGNPKGLTKSDECIARFVIKQTTTEGEIATSLNLDPGLVKKSESEEGESNSYLVPVNRDQLAPTLQKLLQHYTVLDMGIESQSLESVIERIYKTETLK